MDGQETLSKLHLLQKEIENMIEAPEQKRYQAEREKQMLDLEIRAEDEKRKHSLELDKEREALKIRLEELRLKEEQTIQSRRQKIFLS